jgi:hypothetical protein
VGHKLERGQEKIFSYRGNARVTSHGFLAMEFKSFYGGIQDTQVDLLHQDESVHQPSALSDLLGTSMDVDVDSMETELNVYTRVQQVPFDTDRLWINPHEVKENIHLNSNECFLYFGLVWIYPDPLMWWKYPNGPH